MRPDPVPPTRTGLPGPGGDGPHAQRDALVESRALRASVAERDNVLDKVKQLALSPDGLHATTKDVAAYFEVGETVIRALVHDHRSELTSNGYRTLSGDELSCFKQLCGITSRSRSIGVFSRRAVLNTAMLLRDSIVARQVRTYLLNAEEKQHATPVDNLFHRLAEWVDERITEAVARQLATHTVTDMGHADMTRIAEETVRTAIDRTIVPVLNIAVRNDGEQRTRIEALDDEVTRLKRILREREAAGSMNALDAMNPRQFEQHIAWLCRRDGCDQVTVTGGHGDTGADILAYTPDGRRLVVQCKARTPAATITSGDVQQFIGMAKLDYKADVALLVATCPFTRDALLLAARHDMTAVHRGLLEAWNNGAKLHVLQG
ncbi:restriction endonuclease [Streptomyces scopuliridis]|uniref:restriction endonuclease n=1 Tax=Streptomyces scopuliridis TaxID=452529 RepID=UPI003696E56A